MKFLIQTINNEIQFDFQWELIQAIKGTNWFRNSIVYEYILSDQYMPDCIPVGSVEWTLKYIEQYYNKEIKPLCIPQSLMNYEYLKRECKILNRKDINVIKPTFIKSIDVIKGFTKIISTNKELPPHGNYFLSELVDIDSEWRSFVYRSELVGLQNYSGDFTVFPDVNLINKMIYNYKDAPLAYTLDVGINKNGTFIIEVHDFMSIGLYGWSDHQLLPLMFKSWFRECINDNNNQ